MVARKKKASKKTGNSSQADKPWQFKPGESGNPSGRPKIPKDIIEAFRAQTQMALDTLVELAQSADKDAVRLQAANSLLDRGWGKPAQSIDLGGDKLEGIVVNFVKSPSDS